MAGFRRDMDSTGRAMKRMAGQALAMAGMGGGIYAVKRGFEAVTKAAMVQERAELDLIAAVQGNIEQFKLYASQMQSLTVYSDEQILNQMAYAANLGVTKDKLKEATTAAIGLAARYRIDLAAAMMLVGRASQGQTQMLTRYGIIIDQNLSTQDKFNKLLEIGAQSFRLAEEATRTAEGALAQLANTYGDMLEILGKPMAEALGLNARATKNWLEDIRPGFQRWISDMAEGVEMMRQLDSYLFNLYKKYSPAGLLYQGLKGPASEPIAKRQFLSGQLADMAWAMKEAEKQYRAPDLVPETEAQKKAAAEVEKVWIEMWLREEEAAYHAMRAPIIEAETLAKESGERRKRIAEDIALTMAQSWTDAIDQMMFEGKKFWDAMESMARGLIRQIASIVIYKKMAEPLAYSFMGLPIPGGAGAPGPMAGQTIAPSGTPFWPAGSLQHGGTVEKTGWAKVHKGEAFSGVGGGKLEVNVTYAGQEKPVVSDAKFDFKRQVLNITMEAAGTDGPYRRAHKQLR